MGGSIDLKPFLRCLSEDAVPEKPWRTARFLAKKVGWPGDSADLEKALLAGYRDQVEAGGVPSFRYSTLPSRKTLEVLWAPTALVKARRLNNITKDDTPHALENLDPLAPSQVFISHSHRDFDDVMRLAAWLLNKKITPWLAETHIEEGGHINREIIWNLQGSEHFLIFLTSAALESKWTGKECIDALERKKAFHVVLNLEDDQMVALAMGLRGGGRARIPRGPWRAVFSGFEAVPDLVKFYAYPSGLAKEGLVLDGHPLRPFEDLSSLAGEAGTEP